MWPKLFQRKIAAFREEQQRELDNVRHAQQAIRWTPPEFREEPRAAYEESLARLRESRRQESLWWLGRPKMPGLTEDDVREVIGTILDEKGYWNITVGREKNRTAVVSYDDGEGTHHDSVRFHECEEWAEGLPDAADIPPERMEAFAAAMGKQIVEGDSGEKYTVDIETGEIEEEEPPQAKPQPKTVEVVPLGGHLIEKGGNGNRVEIGPEDMAEWVRQQQEAKVEEKELPPLEKEPVKEKEEPVVEIKVNSVLAVLKQARDNGTTVLVNYRNQDGTAKGRLIKVIAISKDEKKFNVYDGDSGQVRKGWFTESVLQAYPSVTDIGKYANRIQDYGKEGHTAAVSPVAGNALTRKWGKTHFTTPEQAERLVATGNWVRLV